MVGLKFYFLCFMAALQSPGGSAALATFGALSSLGAGGGPAPSLRQDPEFVLTTSTLEYFELSVVREESAIANLENCRKLAIAKGAGAFRINPCVLYYLKYGVCSKWRGYFRDVYIRSDLFTEGNPSDDATMTQAQVSMYCNAPGARYYRIENPTILNFRSHFQIWGVPKPSTREETIILADGHFAAKSPSILADPSCYSTSTCSNVIVTPAPEIPADQFLILHDICRQRFEVDSGKSYYILSHSGIGCKNFPNDYPVANCYAEFSAPRRMNVVVTLVNFRENEQCDGFTLRVKTDPEFGFTNLCTAGAPTTLSAAIGDVRIEFGSSANPTREKYGFHIQLTAA